MDRLARLTALALATALAACTRPPVMPSGGTGAPLVAGVAPASPATGLRLTRAPARGALSYAVAFAGDDRLVSIELTTGFELIVRDLRRRGAPITARIGLGDAAYDVVSLAAETAGERAWIASVDGRVRELDLTTGETLRTWRLGAPATAVAVSRDGAHVATGDGAGVVCLRRAVDGALLQCVAAHAGAVSELAFGDGLLVSAAWSGEVILWDVPSLAVRATRERRGSANAVAFDPAGHRVAIGWSLAPPRRSPAAAARERVTGFGAPDPFATVEIWSPGGVVVCDGHGGPVTAVAWTVDGARVLSTSWDRTVRMWQPFTGRQLALLEGFSHLVRDVAVSASGRRVAVAAWAAQLDAPATALAELLYPRP